MPLMSNLTSSWTRAMSRVEGYGDGVGDVQEVTISKSKIAMLVQLLTELPLVAVLTTKRTINGKSPYIPYLAHSLLVQTRIDH